MASEPVGVPLRFRKRLCEDILAGFTDFEIGVGDGSDPITVLQEDLTGANKAWKACTPVFHAGEIQAEALFDAAEANFAWCEVALRARHRGDNGIYVLRRDLVEFDPKVGPPVKSLGRWNAYVAWTPA